MRSTASDPRATMTQARLEAFFAAWNDQDVERAAGFFTPGGAYCASIGPDDDGTVFRGIDEVRRGIAAFLGTYPDARYTDVRILISGDRGHARWTFHGTTREGKRADYRGVDVFEFEGDRIRLKDAYRKERSAPIGG
jgi:beta-alanine degradation protein BauB